MLARRSLLSLLGLAPVAAMTDAMPPQPTIEHAGGMAGFSGSSPQWVSKDQQRANWTRLLTGRDSRHEAYMLAKAQYRDSLPWVFPDIENKRSWSPAFKALQTERRAVQMTIDRERVGSPYNRWHEWISRQVRGES